MVPATPTRSLHKGPAVPTFSVFSSGRRLSDSTISLPPYESTGVQLSPLIYDEKCPRNEERYISEGCYQESTIHAGMKQVHAEYPSVFPRVPAVNTRALMPFDPLTILIKGSGRSLDKGFSLDLPPSLEVIHPFAMRGIKASDWVRFMQDLRNGTAISSCTKRKTLFIPLALGLGPGAFFISKAVKAQIRRKKLAYAINLINIWNQHFFNPRKVEVVLIRGSHPLTISRSAQHEDPGHDSQRDDLSWMSKSSHYDSGDSSLEAEKSVGCCGQPKTPMRLVVIPI